MFSFDENLSCGPPVIGLSMCVYNEILKKTKLNSGAHVIVVDYSCILID